MIATIGTMTIAAVVPYVIVGVVSLWAFAWALKGLVRFVKA